MSDSRELRTMRAIAWERAKGELQATLQTFWDRDGVYEKLNKAIDDFIETVEENGWNE